MAKHESSSSSATFCLETTNHWNNMSVQLRLPPLPPCPVQLVPAQEMKSNHQTSRKSNNVILPARKRCHSSWPLGHSHFAYVSEDLGTYLMPSVLDVRGPDGVLAVDVGPAAAARSLNIFFLFSLFIYLCFYLFYAFSFLTGGRALVFLFFSCNWSLKEELEHKCPIWACCWDVWCEKLRNCKMKKNPK